MNMVKTKTTKKKNGETSTEVKVVKENKNLNAICLIIGLIGTYAVTDGNLWACGFAFIASLHFTRTVKKFTI